MNYQQFEKAMRLIYDFKMKQQGGHQQQMHQIPQGRSRTNSHSMPPPVPPPMTQQDRQKYEGFYQRLQKNNGVPYQDGIQFFIKSGLDRQVLNGVWQQFDHNRKGFLTKEEFTDAMHTVMMRKRGVGGPSPLQPPPQQSQGYGAQSQGMGGPALMTQAMQPNRGPHSGPNGGVMPMSNTSPGMGGGMSGNVNLQQMEARVSRLQDETKSLGTQRFEAERENSRLTLKVQELQGREETLQETIQKQRSEIQRLAMERENMQAQIQQTGQNIEQFQMEKSQLLNQLTNVKQETFRLESILNNAKMQQDRAKSETQQVVNEIGVGSDRLKNLKDQIETLQRDIESNQREQSDSEREESERIKEVEEMQRKVHDLRVTNDDISSKILEFDTKKRVFTEVSNKVAEQIKMFEMKKSELERRLKECQEKAKTYDVQNEKAQCVRLSHLTLTAENLLQNITDILCNRTTQINIVPLEEVASLNDFQTVPTSRMSKKPTEDFATFSSSTTSAPAPKSVNSAPGSAVNDNTTEKPKNDGAGFADDLFGDDDFSSSVPAKSNGTTTQPAGAMDDFFANSTTSAPSASKETNAAPATSDNLFDDFFGDSQPAASTQNTNIPANSSASNKPAPAQTPGFDDDDWSNEDDDFGF
eukprot:CAMPEP_0117440798 /NCGR_PEP_ID=MMETSP0759-20121206/3282_1 /TAXON_ID=63605 /ORGANISM="Percolomonas cosmopolitus, Strain WS" /LENGTH=640 /DNA_ID=CAMNT_0005232587 /DNA_START=579 /DNA_END=2498 /DNA_ORIENTATION=+